MTDGEVVKKHRVLVVDENSMFSNGVQLLLVAQKTLEIIGTVPVDLSLISAEIERLHPDVLVLNEKMVSSQSNLIFSLLKNHPTLRVIALNLEGNQINIFDNRQVMVKSFSDLVSAITQPK
ncbi:MAG: DNA-binding response regulator [Chloroflexi bacterium]|nr:MAG: DNA-binding response regulator [Chloroflexota bacterium]